MTFQITSALFVIVLSSSDPHGQVTLPEIARQESPHPVYQTRQRELLPKGLDELLPRADLVLRGRVASERAYLSKDQMDLYTDYSIIPTQVFFQRDQLAARVPGNLPLITLTRWGGQTTIDGVQVTLVDKDLEPFRIGDDLLLVLVYREGEGKYRLPDDLSGAFAVVGDRIHPLVRDARYDRFKGMTVAQFQSEVSQARPVVPER